MIKIDLVTGFLGTGKTTFIRKYAKYLISKGLNIGIIENDFGAINVDMLLLEDLECDQCDVEPIVGGNVVSDWKRRFKAKLIALSMQGVDRVIVEPSGIYDVDAFFEVLYEEPVDSWYEIGSILTLVDARLDERLSKQADYLLLTQIACSGQIVLTKMQEAQDSEVNQTIEHLNHLMKQYHCDQIISDKILKKREDLDATDFEHFMNCGWESASYERLPFDQNDIFTSLFFMNIRIPADKIKTKVHQLIHNETLGTIFRMKGFFMTEDKSWIEVNATRDNTMIRPIRNGQEVVIVIGENLNKDAIEHFLRE